ncbi:MAG: FAD-binding oxidoreductase, partial [Gammaproteobacteria bacterium]|nr:FAD-binding oxidoreductase [Gammaproteobacteria bacterium]
GMGRGILETAELAEQSLPRRRESSWTVPFSLPSFTLNAITVRAFNAVYYRHVPSKPRSRLLHINKFLYPLDAIKRWNRIYGRTGFYQFQCVTPDQTSFDAIRKMLEVLSKSGLGSFLAVLKSLGSSGHGYLGFPMRGYTLALDIPIRSRTTAVMHTLVDLTLEAGGRVYLAKDACLTPNAFREMYPDFPRFAAAVRNVDPEYRIRSEMSERLQFRLNP